jgi:outer membrane protein
MQRDTDDAQAELQQDQDRVLQELGQKIMLVVDRYATEHGFALILDVSSPQTPVLYAANAIDITRDIVTLYDAAQNTGGAAPASAPAAKPAPPPAPQK